MLSGDKSRHLLQKLYCQTSLTCLCLGASHWGSASVTSSDVVVASVAVVVAAVVVGFSLSLRFDS